MRETFKVIGGVIVMVALSIGLAFAMMQALDKELEIQAEKNRAWVAEYCKENRDECP